MDKKLNRKPIFVHSLWRAGSTYIFNAFRRSKAGYWAYQEPVHEIALLARDNPEILSGFTSAALAGLRHPKLEKPYFDELQQTHQAWQSVVEKRIVYDDYFGEAPVAHLQKYYRALIEAAPKRPVMQDCRTASRIGAIKQAMGGTHIYLWRNPWDQWWSLKINNYFDAAIQIILGGNAVPEVIHRLRGEICYVEFHHDDVAKEFEHFGQQHPTSDTSYLCFYTLWCLGLLEGMSQADQLLNIDALSNHENYRKEIIQQLGALNVTGLEFDDCRVPQAYYDSQEIDFFTRIEDRVHGLLLASGCHQVTLDTLRNMREQYLPTRTKEPHHLTRDLQRAREIALRYETAEANFMRQHHQAISEVMHQSRQLQQELAHSQQQRELREYEIQQAQNTIDAQRRILAEKDQQLVAEQQQATAEKNQLIAEYQTRMQALQQQHTEQERTHQQRITELNQALQQMQAQIIAREREHTDQQQLLLRELLTLQQQHTEREREAAAQLLELQQQTTAEKNQIETEYQTRLQALQQQQAEQEQTSQQRIAELNQALQQMQAQTIAREREHTDQQQLLLRELLTLQQQHTEREREIAAQLLELQQCATAEKNQLETEYQTRLQVLQQQQAEQEQTSQQRISEMDQSLQHMQMQSVGMQEFIATLNDRLKVESTINDQLRQQITQIQKSWFWKAWRALCKLIQNTNFNQEITTVKSAHTQTTDLASSENKTQGLNIRKQDITSETNSIQSLTEIPAMQPIQHIYELFIYDDKEFIVMTYRTLLNREPDPHGMNYYLGRLRMGHGKNSVVVQIAKSQECRSIDKIKGLVDLIRREKLSRNWLFGFLFKENFCRSDLRANASAIRTVAEELKQINLLLRSTKVAIESNSQHLLNLFDKTSLLSNISTDSQQKAESGINSESNMISIDQQEINLDNVSDRVRNVLIQLVQSVKNNNGEA